MKLKAGDKIKMLKDCDDGTFKAGEIFTILGKCGSCWTVFNEISGYRFNISRALDEFELYTPQAPAFLVNDIVQAYGYKGFVTAITDVIQVSLETDDGRKHPFFNLDGKLAPWHKEPTLKLIERPVKEVSFEGVVKHTNSIGDKVYLPMSMEDNAKLTPFADKEVIVTVKLK